MQKSDYIYIIIDNLSVFGIKSADFPSSEQVYEHLDKFDEELLKIIAGFNKNFLEHFLKISKGKNQNDLINTLKKMELISYMVGPTGNLSFLSPHQLEFILNKMESFEAKEITEEKISLIVDEQLEKEFGGSQYTSSQALENQLASAAFYLISQGYSQREIEEKFSEVRQDPSKLDALFSMPQKEIYAMPSELQQSGSGQSESQEITIDHSQEAEKAINEAINSIHQEISEERAQKVEEIMQQIKAYLKDKLTDQYDRVFRQIHPDRLNRAYKILKDTKRKSKRMDLLLEWFLCSHLLSGIELKVEHWQVSSQASHQQAGVYTAGIDFSRYDNIIKDFSDSKLGKVVNIARKILQNPTKRAIQRLGQDLIQTTGHDEHLFFID